MQIPQLANASTTSFNFDPPLHGRSPWHTLKSSFRANPSHQYLSIELYTSSLIQLLMAVIYPNDDPEAAITQASASLNWCRGFKQFSSCHCTFNTLIPTSVHLSSGKLLVANKRIEIRTSHTLILLLLNTTTKTLGSDFLPWGIDT